jgi:hypothetical protein
MSWSMSNITYGQVSHVYISQTSLFKFLKSVIYKHCSFGEEDSALSDDRAFLQRKDFEANADVGIKVALYSSLRCAPFIFKRVPRCDRPISILQGR